MTFEEFMNMWRDFAYQQAGTDEILLTRLFTTIEARLLSIYDDLGIGDDLVQALSRMTPQDFDQDKVKILEKLSLESSPAIGAGA